MNFIISFYLFVVKKETIFIFLEVHFDIERKCIVLKISFNILLGIP